MNPQPGCLPLALGILFLTSVFSFWGCSNQPTTAPSDANTSGAETNQTSSQEAPYPLDFCLISGNDFGEDPDMIPYTHVYEGTTIKFCCKPCLPKFEKNPEKYMADLKEEIEALAKEAKE
jgi:YHS domain-containing protein